MATWFKITIVTAPGSVKLTLVVQMEEGECKVLIAVGELVPRPIIKISDVNSRYLFSTGAQRFVNSWNVYGLADPSAVRHIAGKVEELGQ